MFSSISAISVAQARQKHVGMQVVYEEIHVGSKGPRAMAVQVKQTMASPSAPPKHTSTNNTAPRRANAPRRTKCTPAANFTKQSLQGLLSAKGRHALAVLAGMGGGQRFKAPWHGPYRHRWSEPTDLFRVLERQKCCPSQALAHTKKPLHYWLCRRLASRLVGPAILTTQIQWQEVRQIYWLTIALNCASLVALALQQGWKK